MGLQQNTNTNREVANMLQRNHSDSQSTPTAAISSILAVLGIMVLSLILLTNTPVYAQEAAIKVKLDQLEDEQGEIERAVRKAERALEELDLDETIDISYGDDSYSSKPKMGVYLQNLDFEDAYKRRYPYCHGVLIDGIVDGGNADRAGIIEDDIIMYFDGSKVLYEDHLVRLISSKDFGDTVPVVYFRDEAIDSTMLTFVKPEPKPEKDDDKDDDIILSDDGGKKKKKYSVGYGGGGYTPMIINDEAAFADVEALMNDLELTQTPFQDWGVLLHGGGGQGNVGNGWFLGGYGAGGHLNSTVNVTNPNTGATLQRKIDFSMGLGAFTVDKRVPLFNLATLSAGVGLGGGTMRVNVTQTEGDFNWPDPNNADPAFESIGDQLLTTANNTLTISRNYAIVQPRVSAMVKLTSWMRLRAEYGMVYGYSFRPGWTTSVNNQDLETGRDTYELVGSPDTQLQATAMSLGLWFGF